MTAQGVWWIARRPVERGRRALAPAACACPQGFTLVELMLALALVGLLALLAVGSLSGTLRARKIKEQSGRIVSLLRTARAEAANLGRRFRLSFDEDSGQPLVAVEPDPLGEPGAFQAHHAWWVKLARLEEGICVVKCELTGVSAFNDLQADRPGLRQDQANLPQITFYPDGSSNSARIVLATDDEDDPRAFEITLNGVDGTIQTRQIDTQAEPIE